MLHDGDKGVVLQRDGNSYAIAPHLPCGVVSSDFLRTIANVADQFGAQLKCTSAARIAIIGLREDQVDAAWAALGQCKPGHMIGSCVRSVRACPGTQFCKRARQDSLAMGMALDKLYHGRKTPGTMKMGVAGCGNQCSETCIKDIGVVGGARGWNIVVGGSGGTTPRLAKDLTDSEVSTEQAMSIVEKIFAWYDTSAQAGERLGDVIQRVGLSALKKAVLPA